MIYLELLWCFIQVGLFSIGGGYAALPLIQSLVVEEHGWLTLSEFTDLITISQMTPGPIGINASTFVGIRVGGIGGAALATFGCVLPSALIVTTLAFFYYKYRNLSAVQGIITGIRPATVALIAAAGLSIVSLAFFGEKITSFNIRSIDFFAVFLFAAAFVALKKFKFNPIYVMITSGVLGGIFYLNI